MSISFDIEKAKESIFVEDAVCMKCSKGCWSEHLIETKGRIWVCPECYKIILNKLFSED